MGIAAIAFVFLFYFITDSVITVRSILAMNGKLDELEKVLEEIKIRRGESGTASESFESKVNATREAVWNCRPHLLSASRTNGDNQQRA